MTGVVFKAAPVRAGDVIEWEGGAGPEAVTVQTLRMICGVWMVSVRSGSGQPGTCIVTDERKVIQINLAEARVAASRIVRCVGHTAVEREAQLVASALLALLEGGAHVS